MPDPSIASSTPGRLHPLRGVAELIPSSGKLEVMALCIDHVTISASNLETSLAYYAALLELLGFTRTSENIWADGAGVFVQVVEARPGTRPYDRHGPGLNHLGFGAPDAAFVARLRDEMRARGFDAPEPQNIGGATALFMKDPDGLRFEITHYPPGVPVVD